MQIPVFEIKDSYIVKHKLEYNTSYDFGVYNDNGFTSYKQRMMFVDYDIARKSQSINAENFESVTINKPLNVIDKLQISYMGESYTITFDGVLQYENNWIKGYYNEQNEEVGNVFNNSRPDRYQKFKIDSGHTITTNGVVNVEIYKKTTESGSTTWEYTSTTPNELWSISGLTSSGTQWIVNSGNTILGYQTGITSWSCDTIIPYLRYSSNVLSISGNSVTLEKKIDDYIFNNISVDTNIYYKIITNNHCDPNYSSLYDKLKYNPYFNYFDYSVKLDSITIIPINNTKDIYFNYDKISFSLYPSGFGYTEYDNSGHTYSDQYVTDGVPYIYNFNTNNIYNKYNLGYLLNQFNFKTDIIYKGKTSVVSYTETGSTSLILSVDSSSQFQIGNNIIIETLSGLSYKTYKTDILISNISSTNITINKPIGFGENEKVLYIYVKDEEVGVTNYVYNININDENNHLNFDVDSIFNFREYSYVEVLTNTGNTYNVIITNISGNTITVFKPLNYSPTEIIISVTNLKTISEISQLLDITYENYNHDEYKKLTIQQQRKIYYTYAEILNKEFYNQSIRTNISGLIFENEKNIITLKIFDPSDYKDYRLLYEPTEIVRIGKDRKTSIPTIIKDFKLGINADVINENLYSIYIFDSNIEDIVLVIDANFS